MHCFNVLRNHLFILTVAIKSIPYNIKYPFFKKSFKYIRLWLPKCHFIHKAANTIYSSYIIFFHIKYISSSFICTLFTTDRWNYKLLQKACHRVWISCTCSSHTELYQGYRHRCSPFSHCNLQAEDVAVAILRLNLHCFKTVSPLQLRVEIIALAQVWEQESWAQTPLLQLPQFKYSKIF